MEQTTKKAFKALYNSGGLVRCGNLNNKTAEQAFNMTLQCAEELKRFPGCKVTNIDLSSGQSKTCLVYTAEIAEVKCYFIETRYDNSIDPHTSRNDTEVDTIVYKAA